MSPLEILMPGGLPIGRAAKQRHVRELPGGLEAAKALFLQLTSSGIPNTPAGYPGTRVDLPEGGSIGIRPVSKSGEPTIDLNLPESLPFDKLKFVEDD